jgi:hypothetical protein
MHVGVRSSARLNSCRFIVPYFRGGGGGGGVQHDGRGARGETATFCQILMAIPFWAREGKENGEARAERCTPLKASRSVLRASPRGTPLKVSRSVLRASQKEAGREAGGKLRRALEKIE